MSSELFISPDGLDSTEVSTFKLLVANVTPNTLINYYSFNKDCYFSNYHSKPTEKNKTKQNSTEQNSHNCAFLWSFYFFMNLNKMNFGQNQVDRNLGINLTSLKAVHACQRKMLWSIPFSASLLLLFSVLHYSSTTMFIIQKIAKTSKRLWVIPLNYMSWLAPGNSLP